MQVDGDLLIGLAVEIAHEYAPFEVAQNLLHLLLDVHELLAADDELLGVADARTREHIEQGPVGVLIVDGLVERDIGVQWDVFLTRRCLDRSDDLTRHTELGECAEGREFVLAKIANRLEESDHPLLYDILTIRSDQEVGTRFGAHKIAVLVDEIVERLIALTGADVHEQFLITAAVIDAALCRRFFRLLFLCVELACLQFIDSFLLLIQHRLLLIAVKNHTIAPSLSKASDRGT